MPDSTPACRPPLPGQRQPPPRAPVPLPPPGTAGATGHSATHPEPGTSSSRGTQRGRNGPPATTGIPDFFPVHFSLHEPQRGLLMEPNVRRHQQMYSLPLPLRMVPLFYSVAELSESPPNYLGKIQPFGTFVRTEALIILIVTP